MLSRTERRVRSDAARLVVLADPIVAAREVDEPANSVPRVSQRDNAGFDSHRVLDDPLKQLAARAARGREDDCAQGSFFSKRKVCRASGIDTPISRPCANARHAQKIAMLPGTTER